MILAGGAWMREPWVPEAIRPPVAPLLGEALVLAPAAPVCAHMLRTAEGSVVPRADGTVYTGRPCASAGSSATPTSARCGRSPRGRPRCCPRSTARASSRPVPACARVSADGLPFVGPAADGIVLAGGHGREGIIHAPLCADGVARGVLADDWSLVPDAFRPAAERLDGRATRAIVDHRLAVSEVYVRLKRR